MLSAFFWAVTTISSISRGERFCGTRGSALTSAAAASADQANPTIDTTKSETVLICHEGPDQILSCDSSYRVSIRFVKHRYGRPSAKTLDKSHRRSIGIVEQSQSQSTAKRPRAI